MFFGVVETIVDSFLCCVMGIAFFCIEPFGDRTRPQHHETAPKLNCFSLHGKATMLPSQAQSVLVLELMVLGFIAV